MIAVFVAVPALFVLVVAAFQTKVGPFGPGLRIKIHWRWHRCRVVLYEIRGRRLALSTATQGFPAGGGGGSQAHARGVGAGAGKTLGCGARQPEEEYSPPEKHGNEENVWSPQR